MARGGAGGEPARFAAAAAAALAWLACPVAAQSVPSLPPTLAAIDYTPADVEANAYQFLHCFVPPGDPPPRGWPVLVHFGLEGFRQNEIVTDLAARSVPASFRRLRSAGVAIVSASLTISDPSLPGGGTFEPAGSRSYARHARGESDVVHVVQWLRQRAHDGTLPVDPDRIALTGRSAAAICGMWVALGPDRAEAGAEGQRAQPTRVAGAMFSSAATYWEAFDDDVPGHHFPRRGHPGQIAERLGEVSRDLLRAASALVYGFSGAEVRERNACMPIHLAYWKEPSNRRFRKPYPRGFTYDRHDAWFGFALWAALRELGPESARFHATRSRLVLGRTPEVVGTEDAHLDLAQQEEDRLRWLLELFGLAEPAGFSTADLVAASRVGLFLLAADPEVSEPGARARLQATGLAGGLAALAVGGPEPAACPLGFGLGIAPAASWCLLSAEEGAAALDFVLPVAGNLSGGLLWLRVADPCRAAPELVLSNRLDLRPRPPTR